MPNAEIRAEIMLSDRTAFMEDQISPTYGPAADFLEEAGFPSHKGPSLLRNPPTRLDNCVEQIIYHLQRRLMEEAG
jgi:hypothetical protein